jgi:hypothetical protein
VHALTEERSLISTALNEGNLENQEGSTETATGYNKSRGPPGGVDLREGRETSNPKLSELSQHDFEQGEIPSHLTEIDPNTSREFLNEDELRDTGNQKRGESHDRR